MVRKLALESREKAGGAGCRPQAANGKAGLTVETRLDDAKGVLKAGWTRLGAPCRGFPEGTRDQNTESGQLGPRLLLDTRARCHHGGLVACSLVDPRGLNLV